ncbi:hypothetical protein [Planktothrix agardhii]|uniref:hypothetical protein n=1 Tax=Planktothrix agardhii TaxID=1160 RepID=UPI000A6E7052|nr:hypothetical protein [Planktothrix agardhii]MCF3579538.1 hypothetical protein [Planktothrix agardhii 1811]MCF3608318.1 hypothetical protein [Planktothrix agardhii 1033]MBG0745684.1 hypothetical protein [Planktothrix agardhii KL2]MCB8752435.1 hypothetical protein [Planktothrix agardhii 1810]MCB8761468.1 hypothetical protein [Planktothrix agardhii 1813]
MLQPDSGSGFTLKGREFSPGLPRGFTLPFIAGNTGGNTLPSGFQDPSGVLTALAVAIPSLSLLSPTPARIFIQMGRKILRSLL